MNGSTITAALLLQSGGHCVPYANSKPLQFKELALGDPQPGELLIRIDAAGLCHSDLSVIDGNRVRPMPMVLGHEAAATVIATGEPDDHAFSPGDKVVLSFLPACGACARCLSGQGYLCDAGAGANAKGELLRGGFRLSSKDGCVHHHLGVSAFAEHAIVDKRSAVRIEADIPPHIAALFGCAVLTGVGAVMNTAKVQPGEAVTIYGLGGVGLAAVMGAIAAGAAPVCAIDPFEDKRKLALDLGAAHAAAPGEEHTLAPADVVIETVGKAHVLEQAYHAAARGGRIVTVGLPHPSETLSIPAASLVADGKTLMGSYMGSCVPSRDIPRFVKLWRAGRLPVEKLLSSVSPISEINSLMDKLREGTAVRQIVLPHA